MLAIVTTCLSAATFIIIVDWGRKVRRAVDATVRVYCLVVLVSDCWCVVVVLVIDLERCTAFASLWRDQAFDSTSWLHDPFHDG